MKIKIPFTKDKFIDLSLKSVDTLYSLQTHQPLGLDIIGGDGFSTPNQSEQKLIDDGYGSNVTVYAIIKRIADAGADIPKVLIDENNPGEPITEGEVFDMLQVPGILQGEELTQFDYFESLITFLLASGNAYQAGQVSTGFGDVWHKMEIMPSGLINPIVGNSYRQQALGYEFHDKNGDLTFSTDQIIQTKYVNPTKFGLNSLEGLSPLQAALFSMTGSNDIQKAISIMVKNQGARGILSNKSERPMDEKQARRLSDKINEKIRGVRHFNKVHATNGEMDYFQIGMSATDLKIIESGVLTDRQLCNAYGTSSRLFNDPANSTFNNVKEANKAMYQNAVLPTLNKILEDINRFWLAPWSEQDNKKYKLTLDTSEVEALQADKKTEAEKDRIRMLGINTILGMTISSDAKAQLLENEYNLNSVDAASLVAPVGTLNAKLETLKSLSPLLANKIIEKLTDEEIKALLP